MCHALGLMILDELWKDVNESPEFDDKGEINICNCYPTCNYTTYTHEISWAPYPGPLAEKKDINQEVLGKKPSPSHLCYAK